MNLRLASTASLTDLQETQTFSILCRENLNMSDLELILSGQTHRKAINRSKLLVPKSSPTVINLMCVHIVKSYNS